MMTFNQGVKKLLIQKRMLIAFITLLFSMAIYWINTDNFRMQVNQSNNLKTSIFINTSNRPIPRNNSQNLGDGVPIEDGKFNLGKANFAQISLGIPKDNHLLLKQYSIVVYRNNIYTPIGMHYFSGSVLKTVAFHEVTQDRKILKADLPTDNTGQTIYITVSGKYLRGKIELTNELKFIKDIRHNSALSGMYFGIVGFLIVSSLFLVLATKSPVYGTYALLLFVTALWIASGEGWLASIFPDLPPQPFISTNALGILFLLSFASFTKHYLQLKILNRGLYRALSCSQFYLVAVWILYCYFFDKTPVSVYQLFYALTLLVGLFVLLLALVGGFVGVRRGRQQAKFYLFAVSFSFLVGLFVTLSISATIDLHLDWRVVQAGSLIEILSLFVGFIVWHQQKIEELGKLEIALNQSQEALNTAQLSIKDIKENMSENLIAHSVTPELAKIISLLPDILYIKGSSNYAEVQYTKGQRQLETLVDCNLQTIIEALGDKELIRCHKSYIVPTAKQYFFKRRSSADYDLVLEDIKIPVGRSYLNQIKIHFQR